MKAGTPGLLMSSIIFSLLALMFIVPFLYAAGTFNNLDGTSGVLDHDWSVGQFIYALGDLLCHQEIERSFIINGSQMAMCSRDVGLMTGCAVALASTFNYAGKYPLTERKIAYLGLLLMFILIAEWALGAIIGYNLTYLRFLSGAVGGVGVALIIQNIASEPWKGEGAS